MSPAAAAGGGSVPSRGARMLAWTLTLGVAGVTLGATVYGTRWYATRQQKEVRERYGVPSPLRKLL